MTKLRDHFWIWGHPEGRYNNLYGNTKISRMTPMEGALYLGARNVFMVPVGIDVNRRQYNKSFTTLRQTGWEIWNAGSDPSVIEPLIEEAREFANIGCGVFDDFIRGGKYKEIPLENMYKVRDRLHNNDVRPLDMWMVLYTHEFGLDAAADAEFQPYIGPFDGIILWTWKEKDIVLFEEKYKIFKKMTEGKRRMFGCYLWNFGESKQATSKAVKWQLDRYRELIFAGEAEGVVLHTNTMADLDYPAYDTAIAWMNEHGDEEIDLP
ncbi:MAG: hypothetical protein GX929_03625 [Clostridiales bacterium]|nr:hypothetical protein [Clostridiales bacterium]